MLIRLLFILFFVPPLLINSLVIADEISQKKEQVIESSLKFEYLTGEDGLHSSFVRVSMQDSRGYLWLGTKNGLYQYDGSTIKNYNKSNHVKSLSDNYVYSMFEDRNQNMWFGTTNGFNRYNRSTDDFTRFYHNIDNSKSNYIRNINEDKDGRLWIATSDGLFRWATDKSRYQHYSYSENNPNSISHNIVYSLAAATNGDMWLGTRRGLCHFDYLTEKITRIPFFEFNDGKPNSGKNLYLFGLAIDENMLWAGHSRGLHRIDISSNSIELIKGVGYIYSIARDKNGGVWASNGRVLRYIDASGNTQIKQEHNPKDPNGLSRDMMNIGVDDQNNVWVSSFDRSIGRLSDNAKKVQRYRNEIEKPEIFFSEGAHNFFEDSRGFIWFASGTRIYRFNTESNSVKTYKHDPTISTSMPDASYIRSIGEDAEGRIWLGSYVDKESDGFLSFLDVNTDTFEHFRLDDSLAAGWNLVKFSIRDPDNNMWIATHNGLSHYDKNLNNFIRHDPDLSKGRPMYTSGVFDQYNRLWLSSNLGVYVYDVKAETFTHYQHQSDNPRSLISNQVYHVFKDSVNDLWFSTNNGIDRFDFNSQEFIHYTSDLFSVALSMFQDSSGRYFVATNKGMMEFDINEKKFNYYAPAAGIDTLKVGILSNKDEFYFPSIDGFYRFSTNLSEGSIPDIPIRFTDFLVSNRSVPILDPTQQQLNKTEESVFSLPAAIDEIQSLELTHREKQFSIRFTAPDLTGSQRMRYAYRLKGWNDEWLESNDPIATYTNIPAGKYTFEVKAIDRYQQWQENTRELPIIITPPFWQTRLAYLIYTILFIATIYVIYYIRVRYITARANRLEIEVRERTQEIREKNIRYAKLLDDVSHEFRTPLTIIKGRSNSRICQSDSPPEISTLKTINQVASRLAVVVDDVIEMGRSQSVNELDIHTISISKLAKEVTDTMNVYAKDKQQILDIHIDGNVFQQCEPNAIEKLMNNLLSNAIKYTSIGGNIGFSLTRSDCNYYLTVEDNGIGIPEIYHDKIFDRFTRVTDERQQQVTGSGIGLALVKDVVDTYKGSIDVISEPENGTEFKVVMPCLNDLEINQYHKKIEIRELTDDNKNTHHVDKNHIAQMMQTIAYEKNTSPITSKKHEKKESLLVVEDNIEMRELLRDQLQSEFEILFANNGQHGFELAFKELPQIVVSDINMPIMNGYELLRTIKQSDATSHIPVVLLTAKADADSRLEGYMGHADGYIAKPYTEAELKAVIRAQIENRKKIRKYVLQSLNQNKPLENTKIDSPSCRIISKCTRHVHANYHRPELNVQELADIACLSERQLLRKFQETVGMSPIEYINDYRLSEARKLILSDNRVSETANKVGYSSSSYFSSQYKKKYGISPSREKKVTVKA